MLSSLSLCEAGPASRHASVSFGSLPWSSESESGSGGEGEEEGEGDVIQVISEPEPRQHRHSSVSFLRRPSLLLQHSVESCSSQATATTETTQDNQRRVSHSAQWATKGSS